jgi:hypothetical protein
MTSGGVAKAFKLRNVTDDHRYGTHLGSQTLEHVICDRSLSEPINADTGSGFDFSEVPGSTFYAVHQNSGPRI